MQDRTRRFWTVTMFIIGGPLLTACLVFYLMGRYTWPSVEKEQERLSALLARPVSLAGVRFIRPGETLYFGVRVQDATTGETQIFCPELLIRRLTSDDDFNDVEKQIQATLRATPPEPKFVVQHDRKSTDYLWIIPKIKLRFSAMGTLQSNLLESLGRTTERPAGTCFFQIRETVLYYSDSDFQKEVDAYRLPGDRRAVWREVLASNQDRRSDRFNSQDTSLEAIQRWVSAHNDNAFTTTLEEGTGVWTENGQGRQLHCGFHLAAIPISEPVELFLTHHRQETLPWTLTMNLSANATPIPSSFASIFSPVFYLAGRESWISGNLEASWTGPPHQKGTKAQYRLNDFHLKRTDLSDPAKRVMAAPVRGTIADLYLENGIIDGGIFTGRGSLYVVRGSLDRRFLIKLQGLLGLVFDPPETLSQRFVDDMVAFDDLAFHFEMNSQGIVVDSPYPGRIVAMSRQNPAYKMYLKSDSGPIVLDYPRLLPLLAEEGQEHPFWSRYGRQAITHLPTETKSESKTEYETNTDSVSEPKPAVDITPNITPDIAPDSTGNTKKSGNSETNP